MLLESGEFTKTIHVQEETWRKSIKRLRSCQSANGRGGEEKDMKPRGEKGEHSFARRRGGKKDLFQQWKLSTKQEARECGNLKEF